MSDSHALLGYAHVGIRVGELGRSRSFYEMLGFRFVGGPLGPEPVALMEHPSGICLNLVLNATTSGRPNILLDVAEKHPGYTHMALYVEDLSGTEKMLRQNSVVITEGPLTMPDGTRALFIRDPDGNVIEFDQKPLKS